jgi:hypothetical protein
MSFNSATGSVSGTPTTVLATTTFTVTVRDAASHTSTNTFVLTVNPALATTQAVPATTGAVGTPMGIAPVTAAGGTPPYTFTLSGGSLPTGLTFDRTSGLIVGTPQTTLSMATFTVTVNDAVGAGSAKTFTLTITAALTTTQAVPSVVGGINVPIPPTTPVVASGGSPPYHYALSGGPLPAGMSFDTSTGAISGTPTTQAITTFTVTVTDGAGATSSKTFTLRVL